MQTQTNYTTTQQTNPVTILGKAHPIFECYCVDAKIAPTKRQAHKFARKEGAAWQKLREHADALGTSPNKLLAKLLAKQEN